MVDIQPLLLEGLRAFVRRSTEVKLVGCCIASEAAYSISNSRGVDVVLVDLDHSAVGAVEILKMLERRSLDCKVLLLSNDNGGLEVLQAVKAGAAGCLTKGMKEKEIIDGILAAGRGERTFPPDLKWLDGRKSNRTLTLRQTEVVHLVAMGQSNKEIGLLLGISPFTVRNQIKTICQKLGVSDRTEAATAAMRRGIIQISGDEAVNR